MSAPLTVRLQGLWAQLRQGQPRVSPAGRSGASLCQVPLGLLPEAGVIKESQSHGPCKPSICIQVGSSEGQGHPGASNLFAQNRAQPAPAGGLPGERGAGGGKPGSLCAPRPLPHGGFSASLRLHQLGSQGRWERCPGPPCPALHTRRGGRGPSRCRAGGDYSPGRGWCRFPQRPQRGHAEDACPAPDTEPH